MKKRDDFRGWRVVHERLEVDGGLLALLVLVVLFGVRCVFPPTRLGSVAHPAPVTAPPAPSTVADAYTVAP